MAADMHPQALPLQDDAERLTKIYRKIRDARKEASAAFKKQDAEWESQQDEAARLLMELMDRQNVTGIQTQYGSVRKVIKQRFWNTDWDEFNKFVKENDLLDLFEKRIAQKNMAEWIEKNPGQIPPGLQIDRAYDVVVVKPRAKPE